MVKHAALLAALMALAGCSGGLQTDDNPDTASADPAPPVEGRMKVALLTPGSVSDSGWNAMAYEGLQAIQQEMDAQVNNETATGAEIRDAMRSYAQDGYHLIIGHGFEYNEPAVEIAPNFPETVFVSSSGAETAANAGAFRFYLEQGFYLAGMLAGRQTESDVVAMIGGDDVPSIRSTFEAFRAGAEAVNSDVEVIESFTGSGSDVTAAKQATLQAINAGADFVIHQANESAQGVFSAAEEQGVKAFGANLNQNRNPTGVVIASPIIVAEPAFLELARQRQAGEYTGTVQLMGMESGAIDFVIRPDYLSSLPQDVRERLETARQQIESGELEVPKREF